MRFHMVSASHNHEKTFLSLFFYQLNTILVSGRVYRPEKITITTVNYYLTLKPNTFFIWTCTCHERDYHDYVVVLTNFFSETVRKSTAVIG